MRYSIESFLCLSVWAMLALLTGCHGEVQSPIAFEPNFVHTTKYAIRDGIEMDEASDDAFWLANKMFGTPDEPSLPAILTDDEDYANLVSMENLRRASGPVDGAGRGLFRKHCVVCHGVTGNGRGPTAAVQTPYPRDYRMGIFKFDSTPRGVKPTKDDLARLIRNGIAGTIMVKIPELTEEDIAALVDYVVYLSMRGELERVAVDNAMYEGVIEDDGRVVDTEFASRFESDEGFRDRIHQIAAKDSDRISEAEEKWLEDFELHEENWEYIEEYIIEIADGWFEADEETVDISRVPEGFVVAESLKDFIALQNGRHAEQLAASVQRGRDVFLGKTAACSTCHGKQGRGDGQVNDYDDWTKDWTTRVGLKPENRDSLIPLLARGAMEPRNAIPRNFAEGIFRGGSSNQTLYLRITQGIDGSPMPAATFVDGEFEEHDVWHLINFIRSLGVSEEPSETQSARNQRDHHDPSEDSFAGSPLAVFPM